MVAHTDVLVVGATPGGIATAVRAARDGHETTLVTSQSRIGGMMAGGLSYTDTLMTKPRAPILEDFLEAVRTHYLETYGSESSQFERCEDGYIFEPHVAEETFETLCADAGVTVHRERRPTSVDRSGRSLDAVTFEAIDGTATETIAAPVTVEATYEGDLAALAGVPYRIGRESRAEYGEQFAGELYTSFLTGRYLPASAVGPGDDTVPPDRRGPLDVPEAVQGGELDLVPHPAGLSEILPPSTGAGDDAIQAYNYRLCLSCDPETRRRPDRPPNYDRERYADVPAAVAEHGVRSYLALRLLPNEKADMNAADLPDATDDYPEGDPETRGEIARRHREHALGLLYFLQTDDAIPDEAQTEARRWGLATDEFGEDDFPWQLYVREARRIEGRATFTEHDARHAPGLDRTPVRRDAIAIAEYPLDSHACRPRSSPDGGGQDGLFYASQVTRPSQISYRTLLPTGLDDLLVPVPLSATHVGFGTIRLEPTWMHIGEAAGFAAAQALETDIQPAEIDPTALQRTLVERGHTCSFFNDLDAATDAAWRPAVDFLGTKGFFPSYDARPETPLREGVADAWAASAAALLEGRLEDPTERARRVPTADVGEAVGERAFRDKLESAVSGDRSLPPLDSETTTRNDRDPKSFTRGNACVCVYSALTE
jgi:hypothetical protein